jgi:hypothetical protein
MRIPCIDELPAAFAAAAGVMDKLVDFLAKYGKAPDAENRAIAAYLVRPLQP